MSNAILTADESVVYVPEEADPVASGRLAETTLRYTMPQAEYMYGCVATAVGMLLGYYDLHGYAGYDVSNIISGEAISVYSRGTDGNAYDMDAFDTALGSFIASTEYRQRFHQTTPEAELPYTFVNGDPAQGLNFSEWNCLADWLGTGQYWRGSGDLSTLSYNVTLGNLYEYNQDLVLPDGVTTVSWRFADFKWG